jgi:hypothetical protein
MERIVVGVPADVCGDAFIAFIASLPRENAHIITATDHMVASKLVSDLGSMIRADLDYREGQLMERIEGITESTLAVVSMPALNRLVEELKVQEKDVIGVDFASKMPILMQEFIDYCEENKLQAGLNPPAKDLIANFTPITLTLNWHEGDPLQQTLKSAVDTRLSAVNPLLQGYTEAMASIQAYEPLLSLLSIRLRALHSSSVRLSSSPTALSLFESLSKRFNRLRHCLENAQSNDLYLEKQPSGHLLVVNFLSETLPGVTVLIETGEGTSQNSDPFDLETGVQILDFATFPVSIVSLRFVQAGKPISPVLIWSTEKNRPIVMEFQPALAWQGQYPPLFPPSANIKTFVTPEEEALYGQIHDMLPDITQTDRDFVRFVRVAKRVGNLTEMNRIVEELISAGE